jgi:hypothetical protein
LKSPTPPAERRSWLGSNPRLPPWKSRVCPPTPIFLNLSGINYQPTLPAGGGGTGLVTWRRSSPPPCLLLDWVARGQDRARQWSAGFMLACAAHSLAVGSSIRHRCCIMVYLALQHICCFRSSSSVFTMGESLRSYIMIECLYFLCLSSWPAPHPSPNSIHSGPVHTDANQLQSLQQVASPFMPTKASRDRTGYQRIELVTEEAIKPCEPTPAQQSGVFCVLILQRLAQPPTARIHLVQVHYTEAASRGCGTLPPSGSAHRRRP